MEDERFDVVVRVLGQGRSRRGALGVLAGALSLVVGVGWLITHAR
jgi:hypothetical protein